MTGGRNDYFIEVDYFQLYKNRQVVCGDVFLQHKIKEENRIVSVLSDGLGSGIKANVLATLTSTMALNFISNNKDLRKTAETIMKTLPVCKVRKISYSTFTIADIDSSGSTRIIEYDNPKFILIRDNKAAKVPPSIIKLKEYKEKENILNYYEFSAKLGDRIIFFSDGVSQSGIGTKKHPLGWGNENISSFVLDLVRKNTEISARQLSKDLVQKAHYNDEYKPKDDITAGVIYFRKPRKLLIVTGPPLLENKDKDLAALFQNFNGKKIICGGTTAKILSRELNKEIKVDLKHVDEDVPPCCFMDGADLVTEGTFTLSKILELLDQNTFNEYTKDNAVSKLINLILNSDIIQIIVGTKINQAHQDPFIPVELGIRRNLVKNLAKILEEKYLKETKLQYF